MISKILSLAVSVLLTLTSNSSPSAWQLPFKTPHRLVRAYLQPTSDYSSGHRGVDYAVSQGEAIFAPADGVVSFSGILVDRSVISLSHGASIKTEFEPACSDLAVGERVIKGQLLGKVCAANPRYVQHCSKELCLHFSLRSNGNYLSPLALIGGLNPSRLLPYARG